MVHARSTERRWSRALQHEHSLRLGLQDNMEALANQMHGLEDEARLSVQGMLPSLHSVASHGSMTSASSDPTEVPPSVRSKKPCASEVTDGPEVSGETFTNSTDSDSGDEDKFFDAPEIPVEDWKKVNTMSSSPQSLGHRRSVSTSSVNDAFSMKSSSEANVKEKLPQISSDRRMSVSYLCFFYYLLLPFLLPSLTHVSSYYLFLSMSLPITFSYPCLFLLPSLTHVSSSLTHVSSSLTHVS